LSERGPVFSGPWRKDYVQLPAEGLATRRQRLPGVPVVHPGSPEGRGGEYG
jgi:hypothetical protein